MKIAILSDIHGNLVALEAVLADIAHEAPDQMVCLGDVAATGRSRVRCWRGYANWTFRLYRATPMSGC